MIQSIITCKVFNTLRNRSFCNLLQVSTTVESFQTELKRFNCCAILHSLFFYFLFLKFLLFFPFKFGFCYIICFKMLVDKIINVSVVTFIISFTVHQTIAITFFKWLLKCIGNVLEKRKRVEKF